MNSTRSPSGETVNCRGTPSEKRLVRADWSGRPSELVPAASVVVISVFLLVVIGCSRQLLRAAAKSVQAGPVHPSSVGRCSPKSQRPAVPRPCPRAARSRASSRPTIRYVRQVRPEPGPLMGHSVAHGILTCGRAGQVPVPVRGFLGHAAAVRAGFGGPAGALATARLPDRRRRGRFHGPVRPGCPGRPRAFGRPRGGVPASDRCQARGVCPGAGRCRPGPLCRPSADFAESPRCSCGRGDFEFMNSSESSVIRGANVPKPP